MILPAKKIRAILIRDHVRSSGYAGVVCFTCGNSAIALRDVGLDVIEIGPNGGLDARRWWRPEEIRRVWPDRFDATSGHLPLPMMVRLSDALAAHAAPLVAPVYVVPTGSGETILALVMGHPGIRFIASYDENAATRYNPEAPLNDLVRSWCGVRFNVVPTTCGEEA